jgi:hypothetical protein
MSLISLVWLVLALSATQPTAASKTSAPLTAESSVDDILDALDARGENLTSLSAVVRLTETDPGIGSTVIRSGRFWMGTVGQYTRVRVRFEQRQIANRVRDEVIEYLLAGDTLYDRDVSKKREVRRKIRRGDERTNLLKLGEGPFPLPIGQDRAEVLREFEVSKPAPAPDDPAGTVRLRLTPRKDSPFARRFSSMDVWVSLDDAMPRKILVDDEDAGVVRISELSDVKFNAAVDPADLQLPTINPNEWDVIQEELRN